MQAGPSHAQAAPSNAQAAPSRDPAAPSNALAPAPAPAPAAPVTTAAPWIAAERDIAVKGSYGTKIEAIVRRLLAITADPGARAVVFSTWQDVLVILDHALAENGVPFVYPKNRKAFQGALAAFKGRGGEDVGTDEMGTDVGSEQAQEAEEGQLPRGNDSSAAGGEARGEASAAAGEAGRVVGAPETGAQAAAETGDQAAASDREGHKDKKRRVDGPSFGGPLQLFTPPRVLLLLISQGGAGLNITEAQHVLFAGVCVSRVFLRVCVRCEEKCALSEQVDALHTSLLLNF